VFIAALFTTVKIWKQLKRPSTDEWIKDVVYTHTHRYTIEHYSAFKKNEILLLAMTWMNLEGTMPSEVSQTEKDEYYVISLARGI